jgi:hypothetical protein
MRVFAGLYKGDAADTIPAFDGLTTARFLTLRPPNPRSHVIALGERKPIALFSALMIQIVGFTVGFNGRWRKIRRMAFIRTLDVPAPGAAGMFSIEDRIWHGQRASVSATVGRMIGPSFGASKQLRAEVGCGMTPRLLRFKDTFGLEMHLIP